MKADHAVGWTVGVLAGVGTAASVGLSSYLAAVSLVGARPARTNAARAAGGLRFAILVPAHDEETVIGDALEAFHRLAHPHVSVHVVADNCSDATADVVRRHGWQVHERDDPDDPGKGPALNWLFDRLDGDEGTAFDVAVVIDADTRVDADFVDALERRFDEGALVVQGYYAVHEPDATPAVALRAAALAARHHLRPLGRTRLGGSCGLYGNGMAFRREVLRGHRWTGHLVEDAILQIELLLDGVRVAYAPDARLFAEMPATLERSTSQNERWELGRLQALRTYGTRLAAQSVRGPRGRRWPAADTLIDLLIPPLSVLVAAQGLLVAVTGVGALGASRLHRRLATANVLALVAVLVHVLAALRSVGAPPAVYRALLTAPRLVAWKVRTWVGVIARPDRVGWRRTTRNLEVHA